MYPPPDTVEINVDSALPPPATSAVLPPGKYTFDLPVLKLPDKLPGTYEEYGETDKSWSTHPFSTMTMSDSYKAGHVRYYMEAVREKSAYGRTDLLSS